MKFKVRTINLLNGHTQACLEGINQEFSLHYHCCGMLHSVHLDQSICLISSLDHCLLLSILH